MPRWSVENRIFERFGMRVPPAASLSSDPGFKVSRAIEVFNASEHVQSVAGIARSLGEPVVTAMADERQSVATIDVEWDLSWYRYEIDLCNEAIGPRLTERGYDPAQLGGDRPRGNVTADELGRLSVVGVVA